MLEFKPITAENMMESIGFTPYKVSRTSDFTIGAMYMWRNYYQTEYAIYDQMIVYKVKFLNRISFTFPVGKGSLEGILKALKEYCIKEDIPFWFCTTPLAAANLLVEEYEGEIPSHPSRDWADYLYLATDLAEMAGRRYSGQRNHINRFKKLYPNYQYHVMTADNLDQVKDFLIDFQERFSKDSALAKEELYRTLELLPYLEQFKLVGGFITVDDTIVAMSIGEIINDTLYCHIEKADREYHGAYQMIVKEFASHNISPDVLYINREEDVGDEGLRTSKLSYHPVELLDKYCILMSKQ